MELQSDLDKMTDLYIPLPKRGLSYSELLLVPGFSEISSRSNVSLKTCLDENNDLYLDIPVIAAPMDTVCEADLAIALGKRGACGVLHRFMSVEKQIQQAKKIAKEIPWVAVAIGAKPCEQERLRKLVRAVPSIKMIVIDIAHGHSAMMKDMIKHIHETYACMHVMGGSIATAEAARDLELWGADSLRVGVAGGSVCTTRFRTGVGMPQATAVQCCAEGARIPVIANGGIKHIGDIAKALALGADAAMLGKMFAGSKESPALMGLGGTKIYRGCASYDSKRDRNEECRNIEGISIDVFSDLSANEILNQIEDGLRSAFSYAGATDMKDFHNKAKLIQVQKEE